MERLVRTAPLVATGGCVEELAWAAEGIEMAVEICIQMGVR
jgi:hypothetical protein